MYRTSTTTHDNILGYHLSGTVTEAEVKEMQREMEALIQEKGKVRILIEIRDLSVPEPQAVWQDLKFTPQYVKDLERFALVGDARWQEWAPRLADVLTQGEARYFDNSQLEEAWDWIQQE